MFYILPDILISYKNAKFEYNCNDIEQSPRSRVN